MKVAHFVVDDKFIDGAISLFESDNRVVNQYFIVQKRKTQFGYLKSTNVIRVSQFEILKKIKGFDVVVLHSFSVIPVYMIALIPKHIKVVWLAWGHDLYEGFFRNIIPTNLYDNETKKFLKRQKRKISLKITLKLVVNSILHKLFLNSALKRVDYFSGVFPYECDEVKRFHNDFKAVPLDFYYGSVDFFIPENPEKIVKHNKCNVILGNSGNATNNHLDVLSLLKAYNCSINGQLIIPLSYGCSHEYANTVYDAANCIYPNKVNALKSFMPLKEYLELTSNCRVAIYAHKRQQASDNIFLQLIYGAKVYMTEKSLAYHYLKRMGLKIFSLENDLTSFNEDISDSDVFKNRRILSACYSSSKLINRIIEMNNVLMGK